MKITLLGGGAMATACAIVLAENAGHRICLWTRDEHNAADMRRTRENRRLLPGITIPEPIEITADPAAAMQDCDLAVVSIPSAFLRESLTKLKPVLGEPVPIVSVVKGIENGTFMRPSEVACDVLGDRPVVALCGPSHAEEVARRMPASVVAACPDAELAERVQKLFNTDRFRVYTNTDLVGVELAGALKNVIGIAAGICDGLGFGDNAKSALLARGIVEMKRFGEAFGAAPETFYGLAGIGDLITTCISPHGRNRRVGFELGQGKTLDEILAGMKSVAEGVLTTRSVYEMTKANGIEMPITEQIYFVLFHQKSPAVATRDLMRRPLTSE